MRGLNTSTPSICRRCPAAMCSCLGWERRQNHATVEPTWSAVRVGDASAFSSDIPVSLGNEPGRSKQNRLKPELQTPKAFSKLERPAALRYNAGPMSGMPPLASSPLWLYPVLFLTGLLAGFVDSIAGGGGVITFPVLLNLGMPPLLALGTNKFQASFGSASAVWHYSRAGLIDFRGSRMGVLCTAAGALGGALSVRLLRPELLRQIIPWL